MRVDLRLQGTDLGARGELLLNLELVDGKLGGEQLGEARDQRVLRAVHRARGVEVELERANRALAHLERRDDAGRNLDLAPGLAQDTERVHERLNDAVLDGVVGRLGVDGRPRGEVLGKVAHAGEHVLGIGDGDGARAGLRDKAHADLLGALGREAVFEGFEHLGGDRERLFCIARPQRIGIATQARKQYEKDHERHRGDARERELHMRGKQV